MKIIELDVDSGERDPTIYPLPNDYTVKLNKTLYGTTKIKVLAARLPNCQNLINVGNKQFQVDGKTYVLSEATYLNGNDLASNVQIGLAGSNVSSVIFDSTNNKLTFSNIGTTNTFSFKFFSGSNGYSTVSTIGPPAAVLGFNGSDISSTASSVLVSNVIDLSVPTTLFLRVSYKADEFEKDIVVNGGTFTYGNSGSTSVTLSQIPQTYMGRFIVGSGPITFYNTSTDEPIELDIPSVNIDELRVRFYWNNGTKFIPYDFGCRNHIVKFEITCENDRFSKIYEEKPVDELPPPVDEIPEPFRIDNKLIYYVIGLILFLGLFILLRR